MDWKEIKIDDVNLWPKSLKVDLDPPHNDSRGSIQSLVNFPMKNISLISSEKGTVRSNHYHLTDWHFMYVLKGSFDYYSCNLNNTKDIKKSTVYTGELVFTPPKEVHATVFLEYTELLAISRNPRDQEFYEADTVRLEIVKQSSIKNV